MGVGYKEFWELTPKDLLLISEGFNKKLELEYEMLWVSGIYNQYAFGSTQSKQIKYPKEPFHKQANKYVNGDIAGDVAFDKMQKLMHMFNKKRSG